MILLDNHQIGYKNIHANVKSIDYAVQICLKQNSQNFRIFRMKSKPRFSGFLDDHDFAFNQVNHANLG